MEKKNTVLLTVIAVATLLVAVVGATFAYFTATTGGNGAAGAVNTDTATSLGSVKFDLSDVANGGDIKYPGGVLVNGAEVATTIAGEGTYSGSYKVNGTVTITGMKSANTEIRATMYKSTSKYASDLTTGCTMTSQTGDDGVTKYFYPTGCVAKSEITNSDVAVATKTAKVGATGDEIAIDPTTGSASIPLTTDAQAFTDKTDGTTYEYYYIVVEYVNKTDADQNADFGGSISSQFNAITDGQSTAKPATRQ